MKKRIKIMFSVILSLALHNGYSQVDEESAPPSFANNLLYSQNQILTLTVGHLSNDSLNIADSLEHINDSITYSYSFASPINVNKNILNFMTWDTIQNGDVVGRIKLNSLNAYSSFLIFDDFYLPTGTKLYAYNENKTQILGPYTNKNNKAYSRFSLGPIIGGSVILEFIKPANLDTIPHLNLISYVHSFKNLFNHVVNGVGNPTFGSSSSCNINVMCPVALVAWCNQRRSVALIVKLNPSNHFVSMCTGALVTNEKRDSRPYFLTANHCINGENVNDWIFIFNYQHNSCSNPSFAPNVLYTISGSTLKANRCKSDFALLELSENPLGNYNSFYSGWDNEDKKPENGVSITHPRGDTKKIAFYQKKAKKKTPNTPLCNNAKSWEVEWTNGTVEPGSSGGPLFNSNGLIVGQVLGGNASLICTNNDKPDFGRFDASWDDGNSSSEKLKPWLNPNGTGSFFIQSMSGDEPCKSSYFFTNANDLHTSANVVGMPPFNNPLPGTRSYNGIYMASGNIQAGTNVTIQNATNVKFLANEIILTDGFTAQNGSDFLAKVEPCIGGCNTGVGKMAENNNDEFMTFTDGTKYSGSELEEDEPMIIDFKNHFMIFPNPTTNNFTYQTDVNIKNSIFKITNILNQTVFTKNITEETNEVNFDINELAKGIYFLNHYSVDGKLLSTNKIIKN